MLCDVPLFDLMWGYASSALLSHKSYTQKNGEKTPPQLCVWYQVQETTEMIRNTKYTRYHRTRAQKQDAKWNIHKVRFLEKNWSEIEDLRFKITKQHKYNSTIPPSNMSYDGITFLTPSWPITFHISSATPQPEDMRYERQPYDKKISMMRLTIEFWLSMLHLLPVCVVLGVPWRFSIQGQRQACRHWCCQSTNLELS